MDLTVGCARIKSALGQEETSLVRTLGTRGYSADECYGTLFSETWKLAVILPKSCGRDL